MPSRTGAAINVIEALREPVRDIKGDIEKQVGEMPLDLVRMLDVDPEHKFKTEEELEQIERRERMEKLEGFKQSRRELNALQGKVVSEETIDEEVRKQIEEEEKRLSESLQRFDVSSHDTASGLGKTPQNEEAQVEQQKEAAEEEEAERKKAREKQRLEAQIEAPPGRVTGLAFGKRKRTTPRMLPAPKSAESNIGRGVGG